MMMEQNLVRLEVANDNEGLDLLECDEVLVSTSEMPRANGKDLAVFLIGEAYFISPFTRFGNQILLIGEKIHVFKENQLNLVGKVIGRDFEGFESIKKDAAGTAS